MGMEGLGLLHGSHVAHGDAQAKNLAFDRLGPRAIDLEDADIIETERIGEGEAIKQTQHDIAAFIGSFNQVDNNKEKIVKALSRKNQGEELVRAYRKGVKMGRAALGGEYVPNFDVINRDYILDNLALVLKH